MFSSMKQHLARQQAAAQHLARPQAAAQRLAKTAGATKLGGAAAVLLLASTLASCGTSDPVDSPLVDRTWQITAAWDTPDTATDAPVYGFTATPELAFSEKGVTGNTGCEAFVAKASWPDADHVTISDVKVRQLKQSDNVLETCTDDARNFADRVKRIVEGEFEVHRVEADMRLSRSDEQTKPGQSARGLGLTSSR